MPELLGLPGFKIGSFSVDLYSTYIPLFLVFLPPAVVRFVFATAATLRQSYWSGWGFLVAAGVAWVVSIQIPNLPVGSSDSVSTHLIGGGVVAPLLYLYCKRRYLSAQVVEAFYQGVEPKFNASWIRFLALFAFTSIFGVLNEIAEAALAGAGIMKSEASDTWSDLVANAAGTLFAFAVMELVRRMRVRTR